MVKSLSSARRGVFARLVRRSFVRDTSGATAIEFGILALPFFAIIGAILETSLVFLSGQILDSAVSDASRQIRTGQAVNATFGVGEFRNLICGGLYGLFDCSALNIRVSTISDFSSAVVTLPVNAACTSSCTWTTPDTYGPGSGSSTIMVQVYYKWPIILDFGGGLSLADLPDRTRLLATVRVFRNEPF
ncbi:pilus assembly protein [Devosia rhodophyticola]|uniref:Pilus assembly protein n=1 Tax=Devosia rhodophyticola TaxID=3026423 RepID=A0ABY7YZL8_9HYPH|nr:TadE/TadG family type IV pilus assembly protein [Devosia rhodophyticola]WDR06776.1 pilus assembly protein [Devosia rhodophyticola]